MGETAAAASIERMLLDQERPWLVNLMRESDWLDPRFAWNKANVCAFFSALVYCHIPEFELADGERIHIVPSLDYMALAEAGASLNVPRVLQRMEFDYEIVEREHAIALIARFLGPLVIFVAVRGTRLFYLEDWKYDLNASYHVVNAPNGRQQPAFHRGFYNAAAPMFDAVKAAVERFMTDGRAKAWRESGRGDIPVYATGHSLGGAVAAVCNAFDLTIDPKPGRRPAFNSCYSIGMPRYGDDLAINNFRCPYHAFHPRDVVILLPPAGFANVPDMISVQYDDPRRSILRRVMERIYERVPGIANHYIDAYRERMKIKLATDSPVTD